LIWVHKISSKIKKLMSKKIDKFNKINKNLSTKTKLKINNNNCNNKMIKFNLQLKNKLSLINLKKIKIKMKFYLLKINNKITKKQSMMN